MLEGFALLLFAQLIGEILHDVFALPVPGPVIGMFIVAILLALRRRSDASPELSAVPIERAANMLISHMGLLFVPAGVGIVAIAPMLQGAWLPLAAALIGSTVATLLVTGGVMHAILSREAQND